MEEANCLKYFKEKLMENEEFKTYILVSSYRVIFHFLNLQRCMVSDDLIVVYIMNNYLN